MIDEECLGVTANQLAKIASDLKSENAKLLEEISKYCDLYVHAIADAEAWHLQWSAEHQERARLRDLFSKVYGYYVSGTLTPCDFCDKYCCEGDAPTTCKSDEYDPDRIVAEEVERLMRELRIEVD